jgi:hypothetical protein
MINNVSTGYTREVPRKINFSTIYAREFHKNKYFRVRHKAK